MKPCGQQSRASFKSSWVVRGTGFDEEGPLQHGPLSMGLCSAGLCSSCFIRVCPVWAGGYGCSSLLIQWDWTLGLNSSSPPGPGNSCAVCFSVLASDMVTQGHPSSFLRSFAPCKTSKEKCSGLGDRGCAAGLVKGGRLHKSLPATAHPAAWQMGAVMHNGAQLEGADLEQTVVLSSGSITSHLSFGGPPHHIPSTPHLEC